MPCLELLSPLRGSSEKHTKLSLAVLPNFTTWVWRRSQQRTDSCRLCVKTRQEMPFLPSMKQFSEYRSVMTAYLRLMRGGKRHGLNLAYVNKTKFVYLYMRILQPPHKQQFFD